VSLFRALVAFGAPLLGLTPDDFKGASSSFLQIGVSPNRIDILQSIDGVSFDEAWKGRIEGIVAGSVPAHFISREHLIQNKLAAGRRQDLADVEALREAAKSQNQSKGDR